MPEISLETANSIYTASSTISIIAAFIAAISAFTTFLASNIQDQHTDRAIAQANEVSAIANNNAAQANARAEELNNKNLELQLQIEREQKERIELQKKVGKRHLTDEQKIKIREICLKKQHRPKIKLSANQSDLEAVLYLSEIKNELINSGVNAEGFGTAMTFQIGSSNTGVRVHIYETTLKNHILELFLATGIATEVKQMEHDKISPDGYHAEVSVYKKPSYI